MKHLMITVDWYGPYLTIESAKKEGAFPRLYLAIGNRAYEHGEPKLQYVGIGRPIAGRMTAKHHKLSKLSVARTQIWLGEVITAEPGGRKAKQTPMTLDYAEWLHAYYLQLPLNEKKTVREPGLSVTVMNRWWARQWRQDWEYDSVPRPHPDWPDLIDYPHYHKEPARMVWFDKRNTRYDGRRGFAG